MALLILAGYIAAPAAASQPGPHYRLGNIPGLVAEWEAELEAADQALRAGRYEEARRRAQGTLKSMFKVARGGPDAGSLMGLAVLFRGLAEAGLGDQEAALWDWHLVSALHPPLADSDLGVYGDLGAVLALGASDLPESRGDIVEVKEENTVGLSPPERAKFKQPKYPPALSASCLEGTVVVGVILKEDGIPVSPRNLSTDANLIFVYSAFESLRHWRFKPARLDGEPIMVLYNLSVDFSSPRCRGTSERPWTRSVTERLPLPPPGPPAGL